jgi:hypothetical protein
MSGYVSEGRERDKLGAFDVPELAHELIGLAHIDNARLLRVDLGGCNLGDALRLHHILSSYDRRIARAAPEAQLPRGVCIGCRFPPTRPRPLGSDRNWMENSLTTLAQMGPLLARKTTALGHHNTAIPHFCGSEPVGPHLARLRYMNVLRKTSSFTSSVRAICGCLGLTLLSGCATELQPEDGNEASSDVQASEELKMEVTETYEVASALNEDIKRKFGRKICFGEAIQKGKGDTAHRLIIWTQGHYPGFDGCWVDGTLSRNMVTVVSEGAPQLVKGKATANKMVSSLMFRQPGSGSKPRLVGEVHAFSEKRYLTELCDTQGCLLDLVGNQLVIKFP